ncbi:UbiA-like protein EboC [Algoriphagus sp.]|uniref:UbiA-like protein EboC n=1 Tax=Algoriphagus sp. TaxID=1872435 RepID=UPI0025CF7E50|nr:UbiA-like protein EboC [Algoriphagus sp.]
MIRTKLFAHLQLTRPANVVTAIADILAGFAIAGMGIYLTSFSNSESYLFDLAWLVLATIGLYAGGVALNDVFDADLDALERPERPIPSGRASMKSASIMAFLLLLLGILAAAQVSNTSALIALGVALCAVLYDYWGKHQNFFGPINMGLCRAGNLLLGVSVVPELVEKFAFMGLIPLVFVAAITMISRGEVHGKNRTALFGGVGLYLIIIGSLIGIAFVYGEKPFEIIPFILLFAFMIFPPLIKAIQKQEPKLIGKAVKAAVISLIILNASISAAFAGWFYGLLVLVLLPISLWLARKFAVT